ncbi:MAG TPA: hypothetical protein VHM20_02635 [Gammaproteobacteria bacterium]|jgi:hypothetical protein|nr:hypothetical protein [Gammaproteobacteria bacterium]
MKYCIGIILALLGFSAFSASITLYDTNKESAKNIGTIDSATGIVAIFFSKDNQWIKVGDPTNGNTGWVKTSDLGFDNNILGITFSAKNFNDSVPPQSYQLELGQEQSLTADETVAFLKSLHEKQATVQKALQDMVTLIFSDKNLNVPVMMPVLFIPQKNLPIANPNDELTE